MLGMAAKLASFALLEVERRVLPEQRYPVELGSALIFGLDQLEPAKPGVDDFVERWRAAIGFQLGGEEFEKFCARRRKN